MTPSERPLNAKLPNSAASSVIQVAGDPDRTASMSRAMKGRH